MTLQGGPRANAMPRGKFSLANWTTSFVHDDRTGQCLLYLSEAEVSSHRRKTWQEDDRRFTEVTILSEDPLYAIGAFSTLQPLDG